MPLNPLEKTQVKNLQSETVSRLELKFQAHSQSPRFVDWNVFLVESSSDDLRYETRNSFRGGTNALNEYLFVCTPIAFQGGIKGGNLTCIYTTAF
ncbi:hypothetical protein IQ244_28595 [Nostoc sp. LEGE 06077]|uniref:hypothetical protein n=1 Tax=Nostoc sp. LEGE 06077 TaxID=915325 RepID=UPI00188308A2|nr:hypothetical protein [Nostoc sp. LEGE 06077]MBE9210392.1 hypothetical protein [Nostoc sp. LEGE 06077]